MLAFARCIAVVSSSLMLLAPGFAVADNLKLGGSGAGLGLLRVLADAHVRNTPGDRIEIVPSLGSAGGISAVASGALDLGVSGRDLSEKETKLAVTGRAFVETPFVFATSRQGPTLIESNQVVKIISGEISAWPDGKPLRLILRPKTDAVTIYLQAKYPGAREAMDKARSRPDLPIAATDQDNVDLASRFEGSFAGVTLAQFMTERHNLSIIELDGVNPAKAWSTSATYPLTYVLYLIEPKTLSPAAARFRLFLQSNAAADLFQQHGARRIDKQAASR